MSDKQMVIKNLKELVETMAKSLVDKPEDIEVGINPGERTIVYELRCHKEDQGKIIGKHGKNVGSMRNVLNAAATKFQLRVVLELLEA